MKPKFIRLVLKKKFDDWVKSIEDEGLRKVVKENTIITGGSIASMLLKEKVNDYDLYFRDIETTKAVAEYYVKKFKELNKESKMRGVPVSLSVLVEDDRVKIIAKSSGIASESQDDAKYEYFEINDPDDPASTEFIEHLVSIRGRVEKKDAPKYRPVFLTSNAITLSDKIQIVIRFFGEPDEIHENYDYIHCMNYWTSWNNRLVLRKDAVLSLLTKELKYKGSKYPIASLVRARKFIQRGWSINAGQFLKMAFQISELDLHDVRVLEDQLTGVDVAYFMELIKLIREGEKTKEIDATYIAELIDKIF